MYYRRNHSQKYTAADTQFDLSSIFEHMIWHQLTSVTSSPVILLESWMEHSEEYYSCSATDACSGRYHKKKTMGRNARTALTQLGAAQNRKTANMTCVTLKQPVQEEWCSSVYGTCERSAQRVNPPHSDKTLKTCCDWHYIPSSALLPQPYPCLPSHMASITVEWGSEVERSVLSPHMLRWMTSLHTQNLQYGKETWAG